MLVVQWVLTMVGLIPVIFALMTWRVGTQAEAGMISSRLIVYGGATWLGWVTTTIFWLIWR